MFITCLDEVLELNHRRISCFPHLVPIDSNYDLPDRSTRKLYRGISRIESSFPSCFISRCFSASFSCCSRFSRACLSSLHHDLSLFFLEFLHFMFSPSCFLDCPFLFLIFFVLLCLCRLFGCLPVLLYPSFYLDNTGRRQTRREKNVTDTRGKKTCFFSASQTLFTKKCWWCLLCVWVIVYVLMLCCFVGVFCDVVHLHLATQCVSTVCVCVFVSVQGVRVRPGHRQRETTNRQRDDTER